MSECTECRQWEADARAVARLAESFRQLRKAWFNSHLRSHAREREWESEECERLRETQNRQLEAKYDQQTEGIIDGETWCVAPRCAADMDQQEPAHA